jgi:hypothetical protein
MSAGVIAMLVGLFAAPAFLLWAGHHWRRTSPRLRGAFWGGLVAHTVAALAASVAGMYEPAEWAASDTVRGFLGYWSMLLFFLVGAGVGAAMSGRDNHRTVGRGVRGVRARAEG